MKRIYFIVAIILICSSTENAFSQPSLAWHNTYNGQTNGNDRGNGISLDDDGNIYVTGRSDSSGVRDCITIKYSPSYGDIIWTSRWFPEQNNGIDEGIDIALGPDKSVYVTGKTQTTGGNFNILTIKYDSLGKKVWHKIHNGTFNNRDDQGHSIIVDQAGNAFILGRSNFSGIIIAYNSSEGTPILWPAKVLNGDGDFIGFNHLENIIVASSEKDGFGSLPELVEYNSLNGNLIREYDVPNDGTNGYTIINNVVIEKETGTMFLLWEFKNTDDISRRVRGYRYTHGNPQFSYMGGWSSSSQCSGCILDAIDMAVDIDRNTYYLMSSFNGSEYNIALGKRTPQGSSIWNQNENGLVYYGNDTNDERAISVSVRRDQSNPDIYVTGNNSQGGIISIKYDWQGNMVWDTVYDCGNNMPDVAAQMIQDEYDNIYITGYSRCQGTNDDVKTIKYCVSTPNSPGSVQGPQSVCKDESIQLSVPNDPAVTYIWELPSGWIGESTTNEIDVHISPDALSGQFRVYVSAVQGFCPSLPQTYEIEVMDKPNQPGLITGDVTVCSGSENHYSIEEVANATSYLWEFPNGWLGMSENSSIDVSVGNIGGEINVWAINQCGISEESYTLQADVLLTPETPGDITGPLERCFGDTRSYSIEMVPGSDSYTWEVPGWSHNNSTSNELITIAGSSGPVRVYSNNGICRSEPQEIFVTVFTKPDIPVLESEYTSACVGIDFEISIIPSDNVTEYTWEIPMGWQLVENNGHHITINLDSSGSLTVTSSNMCFSSDSKEVAIKVYSSEPSTPGPITGNQVVCTGSMQEYSVEEVDFAESYDWDIPDGWTIVSEMGERVLKVIPGDELGEVKLHVDINNPCGKKNSEEITIQVYPSTNTTVSINNGIAFSNQSGALYQWLSCNSELIYSTPITGAVSQSFEPETNGWYAVAVSNEGGCLDTSNCYYIVATTSIEPSILHQNLLAISPNPTNGDFLIKNIEQFEGIHMYDAIGKPVSFQQSITSEGIRIEIAYLPSGLYWIEVLKHKERLIKNIVKL